jgi:pyruvate formate lyase activating enzyme
LVFRGFQPQSFSDYQGKIAAVLFTGGCNFRCRFCYNTPLVLHPERQLPLPADRAIELLEPRTSFLDAVVVTGGEPTLEPGLLPFLRRLRGLGFLTGVDTNGTRPAVVSAILGEGLADRLAMDLKAPIEKYGEVTGRADLALAVRESLRLVGGDVGTAHEIRLTLHPALHSEEDVRAMARELDEAGVRRVALQVFRPWNVLDTSLQDVPGYGEDELAGFAVHFSGEVTVR